MQGDRGGTVVAQGLNFLLLMFFEVMLAVHAQDQSEEDSQGSDRF